MIPTLNMTKKKVAYTWQVFSEDQKKKILTIKGGRQKNTKSDASLK